MVPKLENSWPPEKKMKNIVMESDVTKLMEETFKMENMVAGPKPDVQYGLTVGSTVQEETATAKGVAVAAAAPPWRRSSFQEMEVRKLREVLSLLPEEPFLERYHYYIVSYNFFSYIMYIITHLYVVRTFEALNS